MRLLVEVEIGQSFPDHIVFLDENGVEVRVLVEYEWKPIDFDLILNNLGSHWQDINNNNFRHGGRVWLIWNPNFFSVATICVAAQAISAKVNELATGASFIFTVVYGFSEDEMRVDLWAHLRDIHDNNTGPWSVCGDFNNVLHFNERIGREVTWNDIAAFRDCVQYCGLQYITGNGAFFTWNNKQIPSARGFYRIDRFLVNSERMDGYPDSYAHFLPEALFDHNSSVCHKRPDREKRKPPFRYFNMWSMDSQFSDIVQSVWGTNIDGTLMYKVITKLKLLKAPLKTLNKNRFSDIEKAVGVARVLLEELQIQMHNSPIDVNIMAAEREAAASYSQLCKMQHSYLSKKAKVDWIKFGDDNTRFFHSHIRARQIHNRNMCIKDQHGVMCDTTDTIEQAFLSYYKTLLGSRESTDAVHFPTVRTGPIITDAHIPLLLAPVTDREIKESIFSIPSIKSPGPDGFTSQFYKDTWDVVGDEGIAKILCNRLSSVLPDLISPNQGGFVKGRSIVDNVLICQDLVRLYNRKATSPRCLIKIDLRKAYDSVEWNFLDQMLDAMNFRKQFSNLIMKCVSTPAFSLALNGSLFGFFQGQRGLRQGDPLSPLLFTICMEYLSRILRVAAHQDGFHYHPLCGHIRLNHLLFVDDLILFSIGTETAIMWLLRSFSTFSTASGLLLNQEKSEIFFNGMPEVAMANILQVSGFHREKAFIDYYMGLLGSSKPVQKIHIPIVRNGKVVSTEQGEEMIRDITIEEIQIALKSIPANKSPGPGGYNSQFFKDASVIIEDDIIEAVQEYFVSGQLLRQVNSTTLTLIPKKARPVNVADFRPIACCNVLYKIIYKVLCNRLATVLPSIVCESQSAFIQGRDIVDNILICHDLVRLYKRRTCSPRSIMKIDLKKAYDSVEWNFIDQMLHALNFPKRMITWIMTCVTTPSYTIALNGSSFGFFPGKRGIRQGDPLSPLLFTICMDYLSRILNEVTSRVEFNYHPLCRPLKLTHLCFADDLLMFSRGDRTSIKVLLRAFASFSCSSCLEMNSDKSDIYFNGMEQGEIDYILRISGFKPGVFPFRYLGVPISHKRMGIGDCTRLIEKVVNRIRSWGAKKLSYAGRLVLIKAVLIIDRIERICRNYLWSGSDQYGKTPTVNWDNICKDKKHGGMGIVNSRIWNTAVIGKYTSWLAVKSDHLWLRWVCHIYMKGREWYNYTPTVNTSWTWRKICQVMDIMKPGFVTGTWAVFPGSYSVSNGYRWLLGQQHPVTWYPLIWNKTLVPRHAFVGWLIVQGRLMTRDRLFRFGITTDMACAICSLQNETHQHLFSDCTYCTRCWDLLNEWLGMSIPKTSVVDWYTAWRCPSLMKKQIIGAAIVALWYHIWNARNIARIEDRVLAPRFLLRKVKQDIQGRCQERKWSLKMTKLPWEPAYD
ncbi:uncharacterized protein LOC141641499 [Silene latifolia]|uniref:uncharacterized protein LOC141641499 n=1 Tax=Silene latifolia TaxID=37657 RepID=UPI003D78497C